MNRAQALDFMARHKLKRAERVERAIREWNEWCAVFASEHLTPTWPRRLHLIQYPMLAPSGALVTHQESLGWSEDQFIVRSFASDGSSWITVHVGWQPVEAFDNPKDYIHEA